MPRGTSVKAAKEIVAAANGITVEAVVDTAESPSQVTTRQHHLMSFVTGQLVAGGDGDIDNVLMVSHGGFIRHFLKMHCGVPDMEKIANCSITRIRVAVINGEVSCMVDEKMTNFTGHIVDGSTPEDIVSSIQDILG